MKSFPLISAIAAVAAVREEIAAAAAADVGCEGLSFCGWDPIWLSAFLDLASWR